MLFFTDCKRKQEHVKNNDAYFDYEFMKNPANRDMLLYQIFENPQIYEQIKDCTWAPSDNPLVQCEVIKKNVFHFASKENKLTLYSSKLYKNKITHHIVDSLLKSNFGLNGHPTKKDAFYLYCVIPTMDSLISVKYGSKNAKDSIVDWVTNKAEQIYESNIR